MSFKIPETMMEDYPAIRENQCTYFKMICGNCGHRYKDRSVECPACGDRRQRCKKQCKHGEDMCVTHAKHQPLDMYATLIGSLGQNALEEYLYTMENGISVDLEVVLARLALNRSITDERAEDVTGDMILQNVKTFMDIAKKHREITTGMEFQFRNDDSTLKIIRERMQKMILILRNVLEKHLGDSALISVIMTDLVYALEEDEKNPGAIKVKTIQEEFRTLKKRVKKLEE